MKNKTAPVPRPIAWLTKESFSRLQWGGNRSRGTVPVHHRQTKSAHIPLYTERAKQ